MGGSNASKRTPPSPGTKTPSGTSEWKCGVTCKAEPKNWIERHGPDLPMTDALPPRSPTYAQTVCDGHNLVLDALLASRQKDGILFHTRYLNGHVLNPYRPLEDVVRMHGKNYDPSLGTPLYVERPRRELSRVEDAGYARAACVIRKLEDMNSLKPNPEPPPLTEKPASHESASLVQAQKGASGPDRLTELDIKRAELEIKQAELEIKRLESSLKQVELELKKKPYANPLVLAITATALTLMGNLIATIYNGQNAREVERLKLRSSLIVEAAKAGDQSKVANTLHSFLTLKLIEDPDGAIMSAIQNPSRAPVLPSGLSEATDLFGKKPGREDWERKNCPPGTRVLESVTMGGLTPGPRVTWECRDADGTTQGPLMSWYRDTDQLASEMLVVDGKNEGFLRMYHPNGQVMLSGIYAKGEQHGWRSYWSSAGSFERAECHEKNQVKFTTRSQEDLRKPCP